jgi:hypothetical protein
LDNGRFAKPQAKIEASCSCMTCGIGFERAESDCDGGSWVLTLWNSGAVTRRKRGETSLQQTKAEK